MGMLGTSITYMGDMAFIRRHADKDEIRKIAEMILSETGDSNMYMKRNFDSLSPHYSVAVDPGESPEILSEADTLGIPVGEEQLMLVFSEERMMEWRRENIQQLWIDPVTGDIEA